MVLFRAYSAIVPRPVGATVLLAVSKCSDYDYVFLSFYTIFFFSFFSDAEEAVAAASDVTALTTMLLFSYSRLDFAPSASSNDIDFLIPIFSVSLSVYLLVPFVEHSPTSDSSKGAAGRGSCDYLYSPRRDSALTLVDFPYSSSTSSGTS